MAANHGLYYTMAEPKKRMLELGDLRAGETETEDAPEAEGHA
jgi:hypothetical protein